MIKNVMCYINIDFTLNIFAVLKCLIFMVQTI